MTDNEKLDMIINSLQVLKQDNEIMKADIRGLKSDVAAIKVDIENDVKPNIQLLAENYVPAAKKYVEAAEQIEGIKSDVDILKKVVTGHSEKLQQLA